jgi:hypothetical protein
MESATIKIIYVWTKKVPNSLKIKKMFEESMYGQLITFISADSAEVRNMLIFGKYPQAVVPVFIVQERLADVEETTFYQHSQIGKLLVLLDKLIEGLEKPVDTSSSVTIAELREVEEEL